MRGKRKCVAWDYGNTRGVYIATHLLYMYMYMYTHTHVGNILPSEGYSVESLTGRASERLTDAELRTLLYPFADPNLPS